MARINPEHKWLIEKGWVHSGENRMGNRVQYLWKHERYPDRTFSTSQATYAQISEDKRIKGGK